MLSDNMLTMGLLVASGFFSVLSLGVAAVCIVRMRQQAAQMTKLFQNLERNLQVASSTSVGMGKRLLALEHKLLQPTPSNRASLPEESAQADKPASPIDSDLKDALSLLNAGLQPEEVARRCGISRAEASLMKFMATQEPGSHAA